MLLRYTTNHFLLPVSRCHGPHKPAAPFPSQSTHRPAIGDQPLLSLLRYAIFYVPALYFGVSIAFPAIRGHSDKWGSDHDNLGFVLNIMLTSVGVKEGLVSELDAILALCALFR